MTKNLIKLLQISVYRMLIADCARTLIKWNVEKNQ